MNVERTPKHNKTIKLLVQLKCYEYCLLFPYDTIHNLVPQIVREYVLLRYSLCRVSRERRRVKGGHHGGHRREDRREAEGQEEG